jgi:putative glycosyltransferase (TIGR04372 family)
MARRIHIPRPLDVYRYMRVAYNKEKLIRISMPDRIGHLCLEVDSLLKDTLLSGGSTERFILPDIGERFANSHIVGYFRKYIRVEPLHSALRFMRHWGDPCHLVLPTAHYAVAIEQTAKAFAVNAAWAPRPPLFTLSDEDSDFLKEYLRRQGLGANDWFVCLHARTGGYSPRDEHLHTYRNVEIGSFDKAVAAIVDRGGWCIRVGDSSMPPYRPHPRVIDYARSPDKSTQLDVALLASCRFLLGSSSGMNNLALMFGRPTVSTNNAPAAATFSVGPDDICLPQRVFDAAGQEIPFSEILTERRADLRTAKELADAGVRHRPNTAEEIEEVVREMLDRFDGVAVYTEDDRKRQAEFRSFFREGHYSYGSAASIGRDFLRRHLR